MAATAAPSYPHLMDVLELFHGPLRGPSVLDETLWAVLLERCCSGGGTARRSFQSSCASFKVVCRQSRQLADLLTTAITHDLSRFPAAMANMASYNSAAVKETEWWRAVEHRGAFLARLPRLDTLTLTSWPRVPDLTVALFQVGDATQGRLTQLTLRGDGLSEAALSVLAQACPRLRELDIRPSSCKYSPASGAALFRPLHGAEHLTKLTFRHVVGHDPGDDIHNWHDPVLRSLGGMSHLRHLDLQLNGGDSTELRHLTGLHSLRHCEITTYDDDDDNPTTPGDTAGIFAAAAQLTSLSLPQTQYYTPFHGNLEALALQGNPQALAQLRDHDALALLGALSGLQSLNLGREFYIDAAAWDALRRLCALTHLRVGGVEALAADTPCGLPQLQHLDVDRGEEEPIQGPTALLHMLRPLLPLSSLVTLGGVVDGGVVYLDIGYRRGADAAEQAAALGPALRHLAAAPQLQLGKELCLHGSGEPDVDEPEVGSLSLAQVAEALKDGGLGRPWPFVALTLSYNNLHGAPWPALQAALPTLQQLSLSYCQLSCADVACLVQGLTSLGQLELDECTSLGVAEGEWAHVAKVASRPLALKVQTAMSQPALPQSVIARCCAEQQAAFGQQWITWEKA